MGRRRVRRRARGRGARVRWASRRPGGRRAPVAQSQRGAGIAAWSSLLGFTGWAWQGRAEPRNFLASRSPSLLPSELAGISSRKEKNPGISFQPGERRAGPAGVWAAGSGPRARADSLGATGDRRRAPEAPCLLEVTHLGGGSSPRSTTRGHPPQPGSWGGERGVVSPGGPRRAGAAGRVEVGWLQEETSSRAPGPPLEKV